MNFKQAIDKDKNLYCRHELPLITVYDDNWFLRNDYDVLSPGQRNYLISFFQKHGFSLATGKTLVKQEVTIHLPRPQANLAISAFDEAFIEPSNTHFHCVTPTQFAEALFYRCANKSGALDTLVEELRTLIETCPYNIEWLRDISYHSPIEQITIDTYSTLMSFQKEVIESKFKKKKSLR